MTEQSHNGRAACLGIAALAGFLLAASACKPARPPASPTRTLPWGALAIAPDGSTPASLAERIAQERAIPAWVPEADGRYRYAVLAMSGGGAYGAYGAGVLCGWTASGKRPRFEVVTGVSTGALAATATFLGSDYDDMLRATYIGRKTEDVYERNWLVSVLGKGAIANTDGLKRLIKHFIDEKLLDEVAREHAKGRRLYVSTTNLDQGTFTIWDLGAIAASKRRDRLDRYRKVLLAAASIPILFPPVYFETSHDGKTYGQMHTDTLQEGIFLRAFMLDLERRIRAARIDPARVDAELYAIVNMQLNQVRSKAVDTDLQHVAMATVDEMTAQVATGSLYRMYLLAHNRGLRYQVATIPPDLDLDFSMVEFEPAGMLRLFKAGSRAARTGAVWSAHPPGLDPEEQLAPKHPAAPPRGEQPNT